MITWLALSRGIDSVTRVVGKSVSWVLLIAILVSFANAVSRYALGLSSNAWLEIQWYLYGAVFMFASAYTLQCNEHVRIDVLSSVLSKRTRDWIDLICHIFFLLPFCIMMVWLCWPWFVRSFMSGEYSSNAGGLIIWPAKAIALTGFALLVFQAISEIIKRLAVITGALDDSPASLEVTDQVQHPD